MIKKTAVILLCLCLALSFSVCAETLQQPADANTQTTQEEMPTPGGRGGRMGGGPRGGMGAPPMGENGERMMPPDIPAGENGEQIAPPEMPSGENMQPPEAAAGENRASGTAPQAPQGGDATPTEGESANTPGTNAFTSFLKEYSTPVISVILLALAFVFVIFYKRKRF